MTKERTPRPRKVSAKEKTEEHNVTPIQLPEREQFKVTPPDHREQEKKK